MEAQKQRPYRVWCAPCEQYIDFAPDGWDAVEHANRHGAVIFWTEERGRFIGEPAPVHTPAPLATTDELLDLEDLSIGAWSSDLRRVIALADPVL